MDNKYVQCSRCGHIFKTNKYFSNEDTYVFETCPKCGNKKNLYCFDDVYKYYDATLDERFFNYNKGDNE